MRAARGMRITALVGAVALSISACSGDGEDDGAPELPENLAEACPAVGDIISPEEDPGETDFTALAADLQEYVDNADDETAEVLAPLADAAAARAEAAAGVDESAAEEFEENPDNFTDLEPGEERTYEVPGITGDTEALRAADEAWITALEAVSASCSDDGSPLYDEEPVPGLTEEPSQPVEPESTEG